MGLLRAGPVGILQQLTDGVADAAAGRQAGLEFVVDVLCAVPVPVPVTGRDIDPRSVPEILFAAGIVAMEGLQVLWSSSSSSAMAFSR